AVRNARQVLDRAGFPQQNQSDESEGSEDRPHKELEAFRSDDAAGGEKIGPGGLDLSSAFRAFVALDRLGDKACRSADEDDSRQPFRHINEVELILNQTLGSCQVDVTKNSDGGPDIELKTGQAVGVTLRIENQGCEDGVTLSSDLVTAKAEGDPDRDDHQPREYAGSHASGVLSPYPREGHSVRLGPLARNFDSYGGERLRIPSQVLERQLARAD